MKTFFRIINLWHGIMDSVKQQMIAFCGIGDLLLSQFSIDKHFEWNLCKAFSNEKKKFHIFSSHLLIAIPNVTFEMYGKTLLKSLFNEQGKTNMYLILFSVAFFICEFSLKRNSIKKQQQKIK